MGSELAAAPSVMLYGISQSWTASWSRVTVSVWAMFQSAAVNVRLEAETVPSVASLEATGMTTSAVGWLVSTTLNLRSEERRVGNERTAGGTSIPEATTSVFMTATSAGSMTA